MQVRTTKNLKKPTISYIYQMHMYKSTIQLNTQTTNNMSIIYRDKTWKRFWNLNQC